ncbi:hypothetical protein [Pseudomonas sp. M30-35]|nr:hypothetical protein [Pseudomonas sp. M30-35]
MALLPTFRVSGLAYSTVVETNQQWLEGDTCRLREINSRPPSQSMCD